jgi:hypothetical protein
MSNETMVLVNTFTRTFSAILKLDKFCPFRCKSRSSSVQDETGGRQLPIDTGENARVQIRMESRQAAPVQRALDAARRDGPRDHFKASQARESLDYGGGRATAGAVVLVSVRGTRLNESSMEPRTAATTDPANTPILATAEKESP